MKLTRRALLPDRDPPSPTQAPEVLGTSLWGWVGFITVALTGRSSAIITRTYGDRCRQLVSRRLADNTLLFSEIWIKIGDRKRNSGFGSHSLHRSRRQGSSSFHTLHRDVQCNSGPDGTAQTGCILLPHARELRTVEPGAG
ncbi:hypothetical protein BJX65DRAFT_67370 [Aspergillus insuetus]